MKLSLLNQTLFDKLYQDISDFRTLFDLPVNSPSSLDDKADDLHTGLIIEELTELAQADNLMEQADGIVDSVYVLMGRIVHLGVKNPQDCLEMSYFIDIILNISKNLNLPFEKCWNEVHSSNMSKGCKNTQEFLDTQDYFKGQGVEVISVEKGDYLIAKCAHDVTDTKGKKIRQGKVLKSVYYRPADLSFLEE